MILISFTLQKIQSLIIPRSLSHCISFIDYQCQFWLQKNFSRIFSFGTIFVYSQLFTAFFQHVKNMIYSKLLSQWGIWFIYQGESYEGNVHLVTTLSTYADLAYFWKHSPIASLSNFFLKEPNRQNTYQIDETLKKINSIEFFRKGIQPKWEDEQNQRGGQFIFQVNKAQANKEQIYQDLTFFFLGEDFELSEKVNGFRFITSKFNNPGSYRIQIWVNFDESATQSILHYQKVLTGLFKQLSFEMKEIHFKQMKDKGVPKEVKIQTK